MLKLAKINPLVAYSKGAGRCRSPNIQEFWTQQHTDNFEAIKQLIVQAPVLHFPNMDGKFSLECDLNARHVGAVLYQNQNGCNNIIAFFSSTMPDAAVRYSSSELELCGLKKAIIHFQYLLKYAKFRVLMDHCALKHIYSSHKPAKTVRIQTFLEEISDYSFTFEHVSGKNMYISDFLSRFSNNKDDGEAIPFVIDTSALSNKHFMSVFDSKCNYDYSTNSGVCTGHSFPATRSQTPYPLCRKIVRQSILLNTSRHYHHCLMVMVQTCLLKPTKLCQIKKLLT